MVTKFNENITNSKSLIDQYSIYDQVFNKKLKSKDLDASMLKIQNRIIKFQKIQEILVKNQELFDNVAVNLKFESF